MRSSVSRLFSEQDLLRIRQAVQDAEQKTSGEIVPYIVEQSDGYERAVWRGASAAGAVAVLAFFAVHFFTPLWLPFRLPAILTAMMAAFCAGMALTQFIHPVKRLFAGPALMQKRVRQRAAEAFIAEEVFETRERTGILLFVSLLEHHVLVVGDSGINARVKQAEWDDVVQTVIKGVRRGSIAEGLIEAIGKCGVLLDRRGVKRKVDDSDELRDDLRMSDR